MVSRPWMIGNITIFWVLTSWIVTKQCRYGVARWQWPNLELTHKTTILLSLWHNISIFLHGGKELWVWHVFLTMSSIRGPRWCVWLGSREIKRCFYTIVRMGCGAIKPRGLRRLGTTPRREACFLTTHQWEYSCFWDLPPELSMF